MLRASSQKAFTIALYQSVICESGGPDGENLLPIHELTILVLKHLRCACL